MVICNDDQQCLQTGNANAMTSPKPGKLVIDTGLKSYKMPKTAGKIRVPKDEAVKKSGVSATKRENKLGLKAYIFAIDSGATSLLK